jgi:hypothetical protein
MKKTKKKRQTGIKRVFAVTSQPDFNWVDVDEWANKRKFADNASMVRSAIKDAMESDRLDSLG